MAEYKDVPSWRDSLRTPIPYESTLQQGDLLNLTLEEIEHFKREGYLVKRGLVQADAAFESLIDYVWDTVPDGVLARDDPSTWIDEPQKRWPRSVVREIGILQGTGWKMRSPGHYGREAAVLDVTANHPHVQAVVNQFLGGPVERCERVRGIYVVLPKQPQSDGRLGPHVDHAAAQLCAMVLVDEIPPATGGFTVWPRSHLRLHRYWTSCQGAHFNKAIKHEFDQEFRDILMDTDPVEFVGSAGDVVFWHPRLIHSAGVNHSASRNDPRIRYVVPCDFQKTGYNIFRRR